MDIKKYIRDVHNFPKEGILFKDITPLLGDMKAYNACLNQLLHLVEKNNVDWVVGMEARGFFFGIALAKALDVGFIPIRKKGKLPSEVVSVTYDLEYGTDTLQMHSDAIKPGDRVLIHDDVLATGGTAAAACKLVESLGGVVVQCNFLMQIDFLKGEDQLKKYQVKSLLHY
jgi:adenine phosphoribosyltransferase